MSVIYNITAKKNIAIIVFLLFQPVLLLILSGKPQFSTLSIINFFDEVIFAIMLASLANNVFKYGMERKDLYILAFYIFYSSFLIIINDLPLINFGQIFITGKFFIIYYYFLYLPNQYKQKTLFSLYRALLIIFYLSIIFAIVQLTFPEIQERIFLKTEENRGLFGRGSNSFFSSRVIYAEFICIFIIFTISLIPKQAIVKQYNKRLLTLKWSIGLGYFMLLVTASRKETIFAFIIIPFILLLMSKIKYKYLLLPILTIFFIIFSATFLIVFQDINSTAISETYIRYIIFLKSTEIIQVYFPFGSGPGTFGSTMSMYYTNVYEAFNVGENILGNEANGRRGPIYDLFLVTFFAEYGLGGIILFIFMYVVWKRNCFEWENYFYFIKPKTMINILPVMLIVFSIMVPMFGNAIGYLIFMIFGILHIDKRKKKFS
ncbi:MAG: hypothetical protein P8H57_02005 [Emcibacteraceae bacterium]|nr:hypothetical protein [Emcibacteraceae bacterium]